MTTAHSQGDGDPALITDGSWPSSPAYSAVLKVVENEWKLRRQGLATYGEFRPILVHQLTWTGDDTCTGDVIDSWIVSSTSLSHLHGSESAEHDRAQRAFRNDFLFVRINFVVDASGQRVYLESIHGPRAGIGGSYLVEFSDSRPTLVDDPNGSCWIS